MEYQRTVAETVSFEGEGIFSGKEIRVEICPLRENEGIVFERADLPGRPRIRLSPEVVFGLEGAVLITDGEVSVNLIEHLLSALHGLSIDNALIRVYGEEIPLLDGSAFPIVRKIQEKGYLYLPALRRKYKLKRPFEMVNGTGKILFLPSNYLRIFARINFDHPVIGEQSYSFTLTQAGYLAEISFARTFGFKAILEERKHRGILKGGNLANAIVLDEEGVVNKEGLRTPDEFVRHKVLDIIGDIYSLGKGLLAEVHADASGHRLHIDAIKTLYQGGYLEEVETRALTFLWVKKKKRANL